MEMIKPTSKRRSIKLYTVDSYAMRTPITNKINPETNFIVFPTFSPYQLLSLYYLILINILKTIYKVNGKNRKNLMEKRKK